MKIFGFFSKLLFIFIFLSLGLTYELPELEEKYFNKTLNEQNFTFIVFYTSFCSHSNDIISNLSDVYVSEYISISSELKFFKINALKEKSLAKTLNIRGYPSIKVFNRNNQSFFDWNYDVIKSELTYLIEVLLFKKLPHFNTLKELKANKEKFQIFFIGNVSEDEKQYETFKSYSNNSDYLLYNFASVDANPSILNYFHIPNEETKNCNFILIRRRYDNFDKRMKLTQEIKDNFAVKFEEFFYNYSHPVYIEHFNHRIRNFLMEKSIISIGIFYRKKTKVYDSFIFGIFKNLTRNYILELKYKEDRYLSPFFNPKQIVFTFLDTEDIMVRRLAFFMGFNDKDLPYIGAYQFSKLNNKFNTYPLTRNFQESTYYQLLNIISSAFSVGNQGSNFKFFFKHQTKPKDSKVYDIDPTYLHNFLKLYHPKYEKSMHLVEYSATFCLHSKKLSVIFEKLAKNEQKFKGVFMYYGRMQLYGSDLSITGIEKVPVLRLYLSKEKIIDLDFNEISEKSIISLIEKTIESELKQQEKKSEL